MITFTIALFTLIVGYWLYGGYMNRIFAPDDRPTPATTRNDGIDYIKMPTWKLYLIQFLNIAGLGPIFGAIMGAQFGTACFIWIVLGTIFAGAVHDFFSGTLSIRNNGESLPEIIGRYLGKIPKDVMCVISVFLMILVGAVFVSGPAELLAKFTPDSMGLTFWVLVVFGYYLIATILPIDKVIGKVYPVFAAALLFMAVGILVMLYVNSPDLPEMWESMGTNYEDSPIFPVMFVTISCGAISGFHATQSPMVARCMDHEKHCRPVFYGAMVTEGIVALIWAAAGTCFYQEHGGIIDPATGKEFTGAAVAFSLSKSWLGTVGGILAILGIIAAPISTGDTALRAVRLMVADFFKIKQHTMLRRIAVSIPIFAATTALLLYCLSGSAGFKMIWRYLAWTNQLLAVFTLWAITVYLVKERKNFYITLIPALFMTLVCSTYIMISPEGFTLSADISNATGAVCTVISAVWFILWYRRERKNVDIGIIKQ